ncbi:MAG: ABC transporter substrate-binding protein, partial [Hyphomicrobiales bacterium]
MKRAKSIVATILAGLALSAVAPTQLTAQDKNTLVWGDTLPAGLDPHAIFDVPMQFILLNAYDTLYRYIGNPPDLQPWLARSHAVSEDGLTWLFKLNDGVKFHDGSPVTAADVVY